MDECQPGFLQRAISSTAGAFLTSFVVTPLDVIKIRLQLQGRAKLVPTRSTAAHHPANLLFSSSSTAYHGACKSLESSFGTFNTLLHILKNEGITSLWRGLTPAMIMAIPSTTIYLLGFEFFKDRFTTLFNGSSPGSLQLTYNNATIGSSLAILSSGIVSRTLAVACVSPLELVRTRTQALTISNFKALKETIQYLSMEISRNGIRTLWRGLVPTLWRDVPFSAIYWLCYEHSKPLFFSRFPHTTSENVKSVQTSFLCGFSSGALAAFLTTPFDVAKTRRQVLDKHRSPSLWFVLSDVYRNEGVAGLFKGKYDILKLKRIASSCYKSGPGVCHHDYDI